MGRPREHDERTAVALLDAAERIVEQRGVEALSVRALADEVGTSTRAVYSLFGSKEGMVAALGIRAFEMLGDAIGATATTDDPAADLVDAGVTVFRRFALRHPGLFQVAIQRTRVRSEVARQMRPTAADAFGGLTARVARLDEAGLLGHRAVAQAAIEFHALCEGLAAVELRGMLAPGREIRVWRDALGALVAGFGDHPSSRGVRPAGPRQ
ncbi:MAG TPA: helix-turn-helix domain-containing protein [Acidimicrobiales bacterium]|jgi:AcrR family transcriptional regulator|nr:helix-turn-helix domain-containing protein [Acidimicrobiales bacterium]